MTSEREWAEGTKAHVVLETLNLCQSVVREVQLVELCERLESLDLGETIACGATAATVSGELSGRKIERKNLTLNTQCSEAGQSFQSLNLGDLVLSEEERAQVGGDGQVLDRL